MGFCRRCGEIVHGARCKCGGTAVAPVVPYSQLRSDEKAPDKWLKTYIHMERSGSPTRSHITTTSASLASRFPRPPSSSNVSVPVLSGRVTAHITSATSKNRPPSPLKYSTTGTLPDPDSDILPSLAHDDATLSKVYGSVLQPKESLQTHSCVICRSTFPPDATIYPDPTVADSSRFLCRPCFIVNGGSRGPCDVCSRPVLILKSEGGFIEAGGKCWHKRCFNCSGCSKNIGDSPVLDLFGNPSCSECFDSCLKRGPNSPKHSPSNDSVNKVSNIGGMNFNFNNQKSREASPAVEELEQRIGIVRSREGSPALEELSQRLNMIGKDSSARYSTSGSPRGKSLTSGASRAGNSLFERSPDRHNSQLDESLRRRSSSVGRHATGSPMPNQEAIEEMKQRLLKGIPSLSDSQRSTSSTCTDLSPITRPRSSCSSNPGRVRPSANDLSLMSEKVFTSSCSPIIPQTPELMPDFSDTTTHSSSSGPDSPPRSDDFDGIFRNPGLEQASHHHRASHPLERSFEEETAAITKSPTHTPKSVKLYCEHIPNYPSEATTTLPDAIPYPSVGAGSMQSLDELNIPRPATAEPTASTRCADCGSHLFSISGEGSYVTVPNDGGNTPVLTYHTDCFRCVECHGVFKEANIGQAIFVKSKNGPCHVECAPATKITFRRSPSLGSLRSSLSDAVTKSTPVVSSRLDRTPFSAQASAGKTFPRFGSRTMCPGCQQSVSPMERGVIPGPQGTRWHTGCLVCGGRSDTKGDFGLRGKKGEPGCGKKLDSAAKSSVDSRVWCRECWLSLGEARMPVSQMPPVPTHAGLTNLSAHLTGTTTIARQFTGMGGDSGLLRQMTGGSLSPTRSISPTKQLGMINGNGMRPRPKSITGIKNTKTRSIDEGRGMFLVRQLTGASSGL